MLRSVSSIVAVVLFVGQSAVAQWHEYNGHWYRLTEGGPVSWDAAEAEALAAGGHLVTINDQAEQEWLNDTFPFDEGPMWIGLYQDTTDPDYSEPDHGWKWVSDPDLCRWVTGDPNVCYTNWAAGEPNEAPPPETNEDRAAMHAFQPGQWQDVPGEAYEYVGIIELDADPIPTVSEWGLVAMALLVLTAGTLVFMRGRTARA